MDNDLLGPDGEKFTEEDSISSVNLDEETEDEVEEYEFYEDFPQNFVDFLNHINDIDGFVGTRLINLKFSANEEIAKETEVIVRRKENEDGYLGSLLGVVNGFLSNYGKVIKADAEVNPQTGHVQEVYEFFLGDTK